MERTEVIDFHQTVDLGGVRVTAYRAGHVLGAAMFQVGVVVRAAMRVGGWSRYATGRMRGLDRWGGCMRERAHRQGAPSTAAPGAAPAYPHTQHAPIPHPFWQVEIGGMRLLYTGDYSRIPDRHMPAADLPEQRPHIVVVESTYGVSRHLPREEREQRFVERIHTAVARGGRVLLPVVALGRAQELLLILEEYWERHPELHGVPIYQVGPEERGWVGGSWRLSR